MADVIDGLNHPIERWAFPDATTRAAAGGYFSQDIGKIAYQSDEDTYWRLDSLTGSTPNWRPMQLVPVGGTAGQSLVKNSATNYDVGWQGGNAAGVTLGNPTYAGTTAVMMGAGLTLTMRRSGVIILAFQAYAGHTVGNGQSNVRARFGTGTPPAANAALVGTQFGGIAIVQAYAANAIGNASFTAITGPLAIGTTYWFDLEKNQAGGGTSTWFGSILQVAEL